MPRIIIKADSFQALQPLHGLIPVMTTDHFLGLKAGAQRRPVRVTE